MGTVAAASLRHLTCARHGRPTLPVGSVDVRSVTMRAMGTRRTGLTQRRRAVGLSQDALAERLGVDRTTVSRWERGATDPQLALRCRLANVLDITLDDLNGLLAHVRAPEPSHPLSERPSPAPPAYDPPPSSFLFDDQVLIDDAVSGLRTALSTAKDPVHRRALLRLAATLGMLGVSPELLGRLAERGLVGPVDAELTEALETVTTGYAALAMHVPPTGYVGPVSSHQRRIESLLARPMSAAHRRRLLHTAGEAAALVGWFAHSAGRDGDADASYGRARAFARESDDRLLEANICGLQASLHSRIVRGEIAHSPSSARLLDIALALAPSSAHRTRQWLAATRAFEYAAAGDAERFATLSAAAGDEPDGDPPVASGFFTTAAFFASWNAEFVGKYHGLGLLALDRPIGALRTLTSALQAAEENVSRGTLLADLTAAHGAGGDLEQACAYAHRLLDIVGETRPRTLQRLRGARRRFGHVAHPAVDELDDRLREVSAPA
jgi:transcriptional regulator with XRE-family HTH domain